MRAAFLVVMATLTVAPAHAQLLSPGPLSAPHAELQSIRQCTACHQLGQRGAAADRCFACHEALGARVRANQGYHATVKDRSCGSCHAEHYGREFALIRLDTASFDHRAAGFPLRGAHSRAQCRACHRPNYVQDARVRREKTSAPALQRTFLGLAASCRGCHRSEDPHGRQFAARECSACHAETDWKEATSFNHDSAAFRLTGKHNSLACNACHATRQDVVQYTGMAYQSCTSCHADPHRGGQGASCQTCHTTAGWRAFGSTFDVSRFDHGRTRFPLRAAHQRIDCAGCHRTPARADARIRITLARAAETTRFPAVIVRDCRSCHVAAHPGGERDGAASSNCAACHGEAAWSPASFGSREHAATRLPLDGAHLLLACGRCHTPAAPGRLDFRRGDVSCNGCHATASPHGRAFADAQGRTDCARCHSTASWQPSAIAHESFPLTGGHARVSCAACHTPERPRTPRACDACHAATDPHRGQSAGRGCADCHDAGSFTAAIRFDHGSTRFPLEGAHQPLACRSCHVREPAAPPGTLMLRYRPVPVRCEDCHGE